MARIDESFVEEVRRRTDIVDIISEYVQLRRTGRSYVGLCPFHNERTPSLSVSPDRQMFYCFGCKAGGTAIRFVMDIEGLPFPDALRRLAERANLPVPASLQAQDSVVVTRQQTMKEAHELASKYYSYILMNTSAGVQALKYLEVRGLSRQTMVEFRLGYAPADGHSAVKLLKRRGFDERLLIDAGLAVELGPQVLDRFRDRVMIPIADARGAVVAFGGRGLTESAKPKYLNSPDTPIFKKGLLVFNLHRARREMRRSGSTLLLEGYMDVMSAWQAGVRNCVASLGTSLSEEQSAVFKRSAGRLVIAYDGDSAGRKAAAKALETAQASGLDVGFVLFPDGQDPDEFVSARGPEAFEQFVRSSVLAPVDFLIGELRAEANLGTPTGRTEFLRQALKVVAERASPIEQDRWLRSLGQEFSVSVSALADELRTVARRTKQAKRHSNLARAIPEQPKRVKSGAISAGERILQSIILYPDVCAQMMERGIDELASPEQTALLALLYSFRVDHADDGAAAFMDSLEDAALRGYASSLLIDDAPELDAEVLDDYLRAIRLQQLQDRLLACARQSDEARRRGDSETADALSVQVDAFTSAIAELKSPHRV